MECPASESCIEWYNGMLAKIGEIEESFAQSACKKEDLFHTYASRATFAFYSVATKATIARYLFPDLQLPKLFFVTINPREEEFPVFAQAVQKMLTRKIFEGYTMAFEQRGTTEEEVGKGYHCHIIVRKPAKISPAQMHRNIKSSMKNFIGNDKHIDVRVYDYDYYQDKLAYLQGIKWDEGKEAAVEVNKLFRKKYNLETLYIDGRQTSEVKDVKSQESTYQEPEAVNERVVDTVE